jgi:hypothetical protein
MKAGTREASGGAAVTTPGSAAAENAIKANVNACRATALGFATAAYYAGGWTALFFGVVAAAWFWQSFQWKGLLRDYYCPEHCWGPHE